MAELPYLAMLLGVLSGLQHILFEQRYLKAMEKNNGKPIPERLPPVLLVGYFYNRYCNTTVAGDFPKSSLYGTHCGCWVWVCVDVDFLATMNYVIDCYLFVAASALPPIHF